MSPVQMLGRELEIKGVTSYINSEVSLYHMSKSSSDMPKAAKFHCMIETKYNLSYIS